MSLLVDANERALALHEAGRSDEAIGVLLDVLQRYPRVVELWLNLGQMLASTGRTEEAIAAYERILAIDDAHEGALLALYELEQVRGNAAKAIAHQRTLLARKRLFSRIAPREQRRVLALLAPGDFKANAPLEFIFDAETTTLHRYYLTAESSLDEIPPVDVAFLAMGESPAALPYLRRANRLLRKLGVPVINRPQFIPRTNRAKLSRLVKGIDRAIMPEVVECSRARLAGEGSPIAFPIVIRPLGSQAGEHFERIADRDELAHYLERVAGNAFFVSPFANYAREDGHYRKCRIIVVKGEPYPYHLAISPHWMVHYYNTPMAEQAWMRAEEERFLAGDYPTGQPEIVAALRELARRLKLDYFGVDCSIDADGNLLIFEADTAMIVHLLDPRELFPYKYAYVPRLFAAVERMVDDLT